MAKTSQTKQKSIEESLWDSANKLRNGFYAASAEEVIAKGFSLMPVNTLNLSIGRKISISTVK